MWNAGDTVGPQTLVITREQIVRYAGASDDYNPIHYDDERAKAFGLEGIIAHGMLSMGLVARVISSECPPGARLERYGVRFQAMVQPGQTVTILGTVTSIEHYARKTRAEVAVTLGVGQEKPAIAGHSVWIWPNA